MDPRSDVRDFLVSRRAKLSPEQVGLPTSTRRRVPGLRREEVAILAGVSTEWYTRIEKGHIAGVSEEVLDAVARALRLDTDERTYLFDLARAARPHARKAIRRRDSDLAPSVQWMLDTVTLSAAFVRNGRLDVIATNSLARALHAPMFASATTTEHRRANFARFHFLDPRSRDFFVDWEAGAGASVALLRAEAGRDPHDLALRELVGELSTLSEDFRRLWASHDIRIHHDGIKKLRHPDVGELELTYRALALPAAGRGVQELSVYTTEPGTAHEDRLKLLASLSAAPSPRNTSTDHQPQASGREPSAD